MTQAQALDILKMGEPVFLTGRAGSGKTFVLNQYIQHLHKNNIPVGVTASTGIAATHLNGTTIHSWSGIGVADKLTDQDIKKLIEKKYLRDHYVNNAVLIIDEISMLHAHQLEMINQLAQIFRQDMRPFGGLQIVLCGDFFQLPPVSRRAQVKKFVFESQIWQDAKLRMCYLQEQHRQDDPEFLNLLNSIRANQISDNIYELLKARSQICFSDNLKPTKLYTHNADVDVINHNELEKIPGEIQEYVMESRGRRTLVNFLKKSCLAHEILHLKIGAQVIFLKNNFELGVVNGTQGKIIAFDEFNYPIVKIKSGEEVLVEPEVWTIDDNQKILAQIKQIPLKLAWAITVHKSQGMSLDLAEIDLSKSFEPGMGYVALSRVRSLSGLVLKGFNDMALQVDAQVLNFDQHLQNISERTAVLLNKLSAQDILDRQQKFISANAVETPIKTKKKSNKIKTLEMLEKKMNLAEIAQEQNLKISTIMGHVEKILAEDIPVDLDYLQLENKLPEKKFNEIKSAFDKHGLERLKPAFEELNEKHDYEDLKLVRLILLAKQNKNSQSKSKPKFKIPF